MKSASRKIGFAPCLVLAMLSFQPACKGKPMPSRQTKEQAMDSSETAFGLSPQKQAKVKIVFASHSAKVEPGTQRIEIEGTGELRIVRPANREGPDETVSGKVNPAEVAALLVLMESENVLNMESEDSGKAANPAGQQISLILPSEERSVYADSDASSPIFERMAGAVQILARMGTHRAGPPLPFGLKSSELNGVRIFLSNSVKKTGYGKEQLEITGTGDVEISRSENYKAPLISLNGKISQAHFLALLSYMESNGFAGMGEDFSAHSMYEHGRYIHLTLPTGEKGVYAEDSKAPREFIRIYGAVKFLAGIGVPECLDRKKYFFFYL
jgi:hypothetical protein